jgi:hypothetical protein
MKKYTLVCVALCSMGCSFMARSPEQYRDDTQALLESRQPQIKQCYDTALKTSSTLSGQVAVKFTVQAETGKIMDPAIDPARTTAPEPLGQCVVQSLDGLVLAPPDERDGQATFVYDFTTGGAPTAPGGPAAPGAMPGGAPGGPGVPGAPGGPGGLPPG